MNIAEMKEIFKSTPVDQAIMLMGIHGIGKSEVIKKVFSDEGYGVITLFLGQMADAGDLIGLPDRTEVEFMYNGETHKQKITEMCPPKWWPRNENGKLVVFMDEFNRGKPEVYQCVFDMILNRQLNGLPLPKQTRIIAAINPPDDDLDYDVVDLDPALLDRFNVYTFLPSDEEWIDWAIEQKLDNYVVGFINKNRQHLDPPNKKKINEVYPSRRSWERVARILDCNKNLTSLHDGLVPLRNIIQGVVGMGATSAFASYIKKNAKQISASKIITGWNNTVSKTIKSMQNQDLIYLNKEMAIYLKQNEELLFKASGAKEASMYAKNLELYLKTTPKEIMAEFMDHVASGHQSGETWPETLLNFNEQGLVNFFLDVMHGNDTHDKEVEQMISKDEEDIPEWESKNETPDWESGNDTPDWESGDSDIDDIINGGK